MDRKIHLAFGIHNHQPVGNFGWVLEEGYDQAYKPFLDVLERFPAVKACIHTTGPLWQWIKQNRPEWIKRLSALAASGQVEILSGAYYEPILPNIPDRDKIEQIRRLTQDIILETGFEPGGMWLAERVWEPSLAKPVNEAGIRYTILDESHFRYAGVEADGIFGYHITEEQGFPLRVFPISYKLRQLIPFADPERTLEFLWESATASGERLAVFADDGEKFGVWPGTFDLVYRRGWLERFFQLLTENQSWIEVVTFSQYMQKYPALDRTYLPTASYFEMMEWAMPARVTRQFQEIVQELKERNDWPRFEPFVKGGFWRNFLSRYPESNNVHKKSLLVSDKVNAMRGEQKPRAQDELFQGQCNCAYWHGVFGGLYLNHLRSALYQHLITAERLADEESHHGKPYVEVAVNDFDCDSREEVLVNSDCLNVYLDPAQGGTIFELDFKPLGVNLLDILSRQEEAYHARVTDKAGEGYGEAKEAGLDRFIRYDTYRRLSLVDHFLGSEATFDQFASSTLSELSDCVNQPYTYRIYEHPGELEVALERHAVVQGPRQVPVRVQKVLRFQSGEPTFTVEYRIENETQETCEVWFGIEWNLSFPSGTDAQCYYQVDRHPLEDCQLGSRGVLEHVQKVTLVDGIRKLAVDMGVSHHPTLWRYPLETVSQSEAGFERVYQGSTLLFNWHTSLPPGIPFATRFELRLSRVPENRAAEQVANAAA